MPEPAKMPSSHRRFYFGRMDFAFVAACVVAAFIGYRLGVDRGYTTAQPRRVKEELRDVVYEVGDLLEVDNNEKPDFDSLIDALDGTIAPPLWDDVGGPGTIAVEAPSKIRVHEYPDVHGQIAQILQAIRDGRRLATAPSQK